jgi:hypothetical protein
MIKNREGSYYLTEGIFRQIEAKYHFPYELLNKKLLGYVLRNIVWIIYKENEAFIKVPFARNRVWFKAMLTDPELCAMAKLPQIYIN